MDPTKKRIIVREWMEENKKDHYDSFGTLMCTYLAEAAADQFSLYDGDSLDIPDWVFDLANDFGGQ